MEYIKLSIVRITLSINITFYPIKEPGMTSKLTVHGYITVLLMEAGT